MNNNNNDDQLVLISGVTTKILHTLLDGLQLRRTVIQSTIADIDQQMAARQAELNALTTELCKTEEAFHVLQQYAPASEENEAIGQWVLDDDDQDFMSPNYPDEDDQY